jgi:CheY-like chemotaxis protein
LSLMETMSANGAAPGGHPWTDPSSQWMSAELVPLENAPSLILILSDINMPGRSGLEMLPKVRAERPNVPAIMIAAYGDEDTKRHAIAKEPLDC